MRLLAMEREKPLDLDYSFRYLRQDSIPSCATRHCLAIPNPGTAPVRPHNLQASVVLALLYEFHSFENEPTLATNPGIASVYGSDTTRRVRNLRLL